MDKKKRGTSRPQLTVVRSNGLMKSAGGPRRSLPKPVSSLPTRIYFSRGSSTPTGGSLTLRQYAEWLARSRARGLFVVGHANLRLQDRPSSDLADARARAVRDLLVWFGAHKSQVRRVSPSQLHRIRPDTTRSLRASHRSVELIVAPTGSAILTLGWRHVQDAERRPLSSRPVRSCLHRPVARGREVGCDQNSFDNHGLINRTGQVAWRRTPSVVLSSNRCFTPSLP